MITRPQGRQNPAYELEYPKGTEQGGRRHSLTPPALLSAVFTLLQSTNLSGITKHRYFPSFFHPSGSIVAARSGALNVIFTSSVGI